MLTRSTPFSTPNKTESYGYKKINSKQRLQTERYDACYYEYNGISVYKILTSLYEKYGYVLDNTISVKYEGLNAMQDMNAVVEKLRNTKIEKLDVYNVVATRNYLDGVKTYATGEVEELDIKNVNCVYYELEIGGFICVRPSGTEPKLKIYYSVKGKDEQMATKALEKIQTAFGKLL